MLIVYVDYVVGNILGYSSSFTRPICSVEIPQRPFERQNRRRSHQRMFNLFCVVCEREVVVCVVCVCVCERESICSLVVRG